MDGTGSRSRGVVGTAALVVALACWTALLSAPASAATDYTLMVKLAGFGSGSVTSSPSGIDCAPTCSFSFTSGTMVDLTATPGADSSFAGWSGGGCSGTSDCQVALDADTMARAVFDANHRPDGWVKLCGAGDNCDKAPPHPWRGEDVFNSAGAKQMVNAGVEEGNDIRFWINVENDGTQADSFTVQGCKGNAGFVVRVVNIGAHRHAEPATVITSQFENGTATFSFPPSSTKQNTVFTIDIWAKTAVFGVSYSCPVTITSTGNTTMTDKVVAKMHTV